MRDRPRPVPLTAAFTRDPYPQLSRWRQAPGLPSVRLPYGTTALLVTRFGDAVQILNDPAVRKDIRPALRLLSAGHSGAQILSEHMLNADPPEHARLRRLAAPAVSRGRACRWMTDINQIVNQLVDSVERRGEADLIADLALPLPVTLVCRMLGVPAADRKLVVGWSSDLVTQADPRSVGASTASLGRYLSDLLRRKAARPGSDGLSLLAAHGPGGSALLTDTELVSTAFLLLFAGYETTMNLIGNGMLALLQHPDQFAALRQDDSLLPGAVEELLRYDSPVAHATIRYAAADIDVGGFPVRRGRFLLVSLAGANRDEDRFDHPAVLDIGRPPPRHLAFGSGPHYCLGAELARTEGQVAIATLIRRLPRLRLAVDAAILRRRESTLMRGLEALPVRCD